MQYDENAERYGYEGEMMPLKCDELKAYKGDVYIPVYGSIADAEVYLKKDVDAAIAELKDVIHELQVDLEGAKATAYAESVDAYFAEQLAEKDKEIALLKERICNGDVSRITWIDDCIAKDKEIAELKADYKEACDRLQTANLIKDEKLAEARHEKYKRCLAMAWWCSAELGMLVSTWESKIKYYKRWQKRWLQLAEKFKEAK